MEVVLPCMALSLPPCSHLSPSPCIAVCPCRSSSLSLLCRHPCLPFSNAFSSLRVLAFARSPGPRKNSLHMPGLQSLEWLPGSLRPLNQIPRQEFSSHPQNSVVFEGTGASSAQKPSFLANDFRYRGCECALFKETIRGGRQKTTIDIGAIANIHGQKGRSRLQSVWNRRTGANFADDRVDKNWELESEDLFEGVSPTIARNRPEPRDRAVWQPFELEAVEFGREADLRFMFLESLMGKAREGDAEGTEVVISDMIAAGLKLGPRSYHGLVVSYAMSGDTEGTLQALRREVYAGQRPLQETFTALIRLFAATGQQQRGEELLGAMGNYNLDIRSSWLVFLDELLKRGYLKEASDVFLRGAKGGLKATNQLYDALVEANAKVNDHANCVSILQHMEYSGRMCKTFHYNCLLMIEANLGEADIILETFELMRYGDDEKKPDTESYNWLFQSQIRCESGGDRIQQVIDLLGLMVEDHKRVQPNAKTYGILVECFTKYNVADEAIRHFRALSKIPGGMQLLHNNGNYGDPLSLYLRLLCLEGRIDDLLEALKVLENDNHPIPPRAVIVNRQGRSLVSSWLEPLQQEADLGYEIDYIARYIAEGGLTGTRKRWSPSLDGKSLPVNPDNEGFAYGAPTEISFKRHCGELRSNYALSLFKKLRREGVDALGTGATEADLRVVMDKLRKDTIAESTPPVRKPKAASKMLVSELKEELEAQGLPSDGTRPVLYQRVQKSRRINRARGRPLWLPPEVEEPEQVDNKLEKFMTRLSLENEYDTEYWRKRFFEATEKLEETSSAEKGNESDSLAETTGGNDGKDGDREEEAEEETDELEDGGEEEEAEPPTMLATQLMDTAAAEALEMQRRDEYYFEFNLEEQLAELKKYKRFGVSDMYTIADVWGWTWEKDLDVCKPEKWSKEREVKLGMEIMQKVVLLGGAPAIGDCAMLLRAALRVPWPEAMVNILHQTHKLGYVFGSTLYDEAVTLCIKLDEREAAIAIVADMEEKGINVPDEILDKILPEELPVEGISG